MKNNLHSINWPNDFQYLQVGQFTIKVHLVYTNTLGKKKQNISVKKYLLKSWDKNSYKVDKIKQTPPTKYISKQVKRVQTKEKEI